MSLQLYSQILLGTKWSLTAFTHAVLRSHVFKLIYIEIWRKEETHRCRCLQSWLRVVFHFFAHYFLFFLIVIRRQVILTCLRILNDFLLCWFTTFLLLILLPLTQVVSRHFNVVFKEDYASLRYLLCVDKRLESRLDCIRRIVIAPEFCLETVAGFYSETVFEVEQNHALSNFTSSVL